MPGMQFLGVDLSPKMLEFARENKNKYGLTNLNFKAADMYKLPESVDGPFDLITWHLAMHHCMTQDDVVCVLKNIPRLLKPGGTFFVFDINRPKNGHLALTMADTFNRTEGDWFYQDSLDSYKAAFSFDEVKNIIKSSGLQHVRHIEPIMCNMFQAFYISQTDNKNAVKVSNLKHFWQKMDHALLKANFYALPQAVVRIKDKVREPSVSIGPPAGSILKEFNQDLIDVLQVGTQAMSAYNVQPWRFRVDGDQVFIHILRHKNFFLKLQGVYPMMAGHLLANMMEGARSKGYQVEYEIISEALNVDEPCIRMKLKKGFGRADITHVLERCTNRSFYSSQKIDKDIQREIIALGDDPNVRIDFVEDQAKENLAQILSHL